MIINQGSVEDIRCSLRFLKPDCSVESLEEEVKAEKAGRNRITVIKMLEREIRKRKK